MESIGRRRFLTGLLGLPLGLAGLARLAGGATDSEFRKAAYQARVSLLYGAFRMDLNGTIEETVDRAAGRYLSRIEGRGESYENHGESTGMLLDDGRWAPTRTRSQFIVYGRESNLTVAYDWSRRLVDYESRSETFMLRRVRQAKATLPIPPGQHLDDVSSATLNLADNRWTPGPDGSLVTHVVRRRRGSRDGSEEPGGVYGVEVVPFTLRLRPDGDKPVALVDLTRFSSWAKEDEPGRIVFGPDRRPELITCSMILGTSLSIRLSSTTG